MLDGWVGTQLAIAIDATSLGGLFVALVVSVVYRGCAGRLENPEGRGEACLETGMAGIVETVPGSFARRLDGDCAGGPRTVCEVAV